MYTYIMYVMIKIDYVSLKQFRGLDQHPTDPSLCRKCFKEYQRKIKENKG